MLATSVNDRCRLVQPSRVTIPGVLVHDVIFLSELHRGSGSLDACAARLAEGLVDLLELGLDDLPPRRFVVEQELDLGGPLPLLLQLIEDVADLELAQAIELGLEDGIGLDLAQLEPPDQLGCGVCLAVAVADDLDRLVEVLEDDCEPLEDMDSLEQVLELEPQASDHNFHAEIEKVLENRRQVEPAGNSDLGARGR